MGSPTFLDWLYSIGIIPKHTFSRKHKDKDFQWELGYFVVYPTLYLLFFIIEYEHSENIKKIKITVRITSPMIYIRIQWICLSIDVQNQLHTSSPIAKYNPILIFPAYYITTTQ